MPHSVLVPALGAILLLAACGLKAPLVLPARSAPPVPVATRPAPEATPPACGSGQSSPSATGTCQ